MISVVLSCGKDGEFRSLHATGHANYKRAGEDVVCSAVSILTRVAALQLDEWAVSGKGLESTASYPRRGEAKVFVSDYKESILPSLVHLFNFLKLGFGSIAFEYPEYVSFKVERE